MQAATISQPKQVASNAEETTSFRNQVRFMRPTLTDDDQLVSKIAFLYFM